MNIEICIPIYNEEKILRKNVLKLLDFCDSKNYQFDWKIILIINGSNDNSLKIAEELAKNNPRINFVNISESGKGNALKNYFKKSQVDILIYMDIDLAVSLENLDNLITPLLEKKANLVMGSRLLPNSKTDRTFIRELSSQCYNFLSKIILRHNFSDLQCGFKAMEKKVFENISPYIKNKKWFFDTELIVFTKLKNYKIIEIPVDWSENRYEERKSKVSVIKDGFKFLYNLICLKFRTINFK